MEKKNSIKSNSCCSWQPKNSHVHGSSRNVFSRERDSTSILDHQSQIESVMSNLIKKETPQPRRLIKYMLNKH